MEIELKRDIYEELLKWKKRSSGLVLELEGARQVGKTYILDKFAREQYQQYIYINMIGESGNISWNVTKRRIIEEMYRTRQKMAWPQY